MALSFYQGLAYPDTLHRHSSETTQLTLSVAISLSYQDHHSSPVIRDDRIHQTFEEIQVFTDRSLKYYSLRAGIKVSHTRIY